MVALLDRQWPMIGEYLRSMEISDVDPAMQQGNAPPSEAKKAMSQRAWARAISTSSARVKAIDRRRATFHHDILIKWFKTAEIPNSELPNRMDFPAEIYRRAARPLNPVREDGRGLTASACLGEGPNDLEIMGASSQALTGWIRGIAAIGLPAIRIIGA
jgi:hypothetical protein